MSPIRGTFFAVSTCCALHHGNAKGREKLPAIANKNCLRGWGDKTGRCGHRRFHAGAIPFYAFTPGVDANPTVLIARRAARRITVLPQGAL
jgi:hypothetical protein